jgi:hypothetical protein
MTQHASYVYDALLHRTPDVNVQQRVYKYASHNKDIELLVRLCHLANLDPDMDQLLSKRQEADVLVAWASRPGRTSEELIERFSKEKRATLLTQVATKGDLPDTLYLELAQHPSASVGEAILSNSKAPVAARAAAAANAMRTVRTSWSTQSRVAELFRNAPAEAANAAVNAAPSIPHLCGLVPSINPDAQQNVVTRLVELLIATKHEHDYQTRSSTETVWGHLTLVSRKEFVAAVEAAVAKGELGTEGSSHFLRELLNRPTVDPIEVALETLATSVDAGDIHAALTKVVNDGSYHQRREGIRRAIVNSNASVESIINHIGYADRDDVELLASRVVDSDALLLILMETSGRQVVSALESAGRDPKVLIRQVAKGAETPGWVKTLRAVEKDPSFALEILGAHDVFTAHSSVDAARELVLSRLGDDDSRWELLDRLIGEWSGTLPGLLDLIENL